MLRAVADVSPVDAPAGEVDVVHTKVGLAALGPFGDGVVPEWFKSVVVVTFPSAVGDTADPCIHQNIPPTIPAAISRARILRIFIMNNWYNHLPKNAELSRDLTPFSRPRQPQKSNFYQSLKLMSRAAT
jgi:hypothetical protein